MPMQDVTVEECADGRVVVMSPSAHCPGDEMTLHLTTADGLESHAARVVSSSPAAVGGTLCFRIELCISAAPSSRGELDVAEDKS